MTQPQSRPHLEHGGAARAWRPISFALVGLAISLPSVARADDAGARCDRVSMSVALTPTDANRYTVAGWVCGPHGPQTPVIQLLLHGSTYSHSYWDFPSTSTTYSYVAAATLAGFATLNIDRIGIGESDHPPALDVTVESNAFVVHQIVGALRSGSLAPGGRPLVAQQVVLVGHSLGSVIAAEETALYADADALVLSGFLHNQGPGIPAFEVSFYPAMFDPVTAGAPPLYFTSIPGTRAASFYSLSDADPQIIAADEATKQTVTLGELNTFVDGFGATFGIHVPTLVAAGDKDALFCDAPSCSAGGTMTREAAFYPADACLETFLLPDAGHSMNLHRNAPLWFDAANQWIRRHGGRGDSPNTCRGR